MVITKNDGEPHQVEETHVRSCRGTAGGWNLGQTLQFFQQTTQKTSAVVGAAVSFIVEHQNLLELGGASATELYG